MYNSGASVSRCVQEWVCARKPRRLAFDMNGYLFELQLFLNYLAAAGVPSSYALLWLALTQVCYRTYPAALLRGGLGLGEVVRGLRLKYRLLVALLYYWLELGRWCALQPESVDFPAKALAYRIVRGALFALAVLDWASAFNKQCLEARSSKLARFDVFGLLGSSGVLCAAIFKQSLRAMAGSGLGLEGCWVWEAVLASFAIRAFGKIADAFLLVSLVARGFWRGFSGL